MTFVSACSKSTADIAAAKEGRSEDIRTYLNEGGNPDITNDQGQSLLLLAAIEKHPDKEIEAILRQAGATE